MTEKMEAKIRAYLEECSGEELIQIVRELNSYSGDLENLTYYSMDEFDELNEGMTPWEIARACYFGNFNPTDEYWCYNGYANFESIAEYAVVDELKDYFGDILSEIGSMPYQYLPSGIQDIYNEGEEDGDEEGEEDEE